MFLKEVLYAYQVFILKKLLQINENISVLT